MDNTVQEGEYKTSSPTPNATPKNLMGFSDAIQAIAAGKKVTRVEWNTEFEYGYLLDGWLSLHREGVDHKWLVNDGDLLATDWYILK